MMRKISQTLCVIGVLFVFSGAVFGAPEKIALKNGITVILNKDITSPIIAVTVFVKNGSSYETAQKNGVTNLAFELLDKGTTTRSASKFAEEIESVGASYSASAGEDFSTVALLSAQKYFPKALDLLADSLLNPSFTAEELEKVKKDVLAVLKSREDRSFDYTYRLFKEEFYAGHFYSMDILGTPETLAALSKEDVSAAYKSGLSADRIIISVSGDFFADITDMLERRFGSIPTGVIEYSTLIAKFVLKENKEKTVKREKAQSMLFLGFAAPGVANKDFPAMKVLSSALGGGMSSKLFNELREKQGLAYEIGAFSPTRMHESHFVFYAGTRPENLTALKAGLLAQIESLKAGTALSESDVTATKNYMIGNFFLDKQTNARRSWYLGWYEVMGKGFGYIDGYAEDISKVTLADLNKAAQKYFNMSVLVTLESNQK